MRVPPALPGTGGEGGTDADAVAAQARVDAARVKYAHGALIAHGDGLVAGELFREAHALLVQSGRVTNAKAGSGIGSKSDLQLEWDTLYALARRHGSSAWRLRPRARACVIGARYRRRCPLALGRPSLLLDWKKAEVEGPEAKEAPPKKTQRQ